MTQRRENDRVARAMVGKPIYAWDDPKEGCDPPLIRYPAAIAATVPRKHSEPKVDGHTHHHRRQGEHKRCCYRLNYHRHQEQPSFYDKEALEEKLRDFKAEKLDLSHKDVELRSRFAAAKDTLLAMRSKKRDLSTAKALDKLVNAGGNTNRGTTARAREPYLFSKERSHESHKESDSRREERAERRQELTSVSVLFKANMCKSICSRGVDEVVRNACTCGLFLPLGVFWRTKRATRMEWCEIHTSITTSCRKRVRVVYHNIAGMDQMRKRVVQVAADCGHVTPLLHSPT